MRNFNDVYQGLKVKANKLKATHFQQSGSIESGATENTQLAALLVKGLYDRYSFEWQNFEKALISEATDRGYAIQSVLQNFPQPILPAETINVGLTGDWEFYDGQCF